MASFSDLLAVFICTATPATSVLLLILLVVVENYIVRLLRGKRTAVASPTTSPATRSADSPPTTRQKVKAVLEAILQFVSIAILTKMATLLFAEIWEIVEAAYEEGSSFTPIVVCLLVGGVAAVFLVHIAEGGHEHEHSTGSGAVAVEGSPSTTAPSSSRGVIFAMLIHTCAEGLAAGIVMSSKGSAAADDHADEHGGGISSMLDITSSYFISLALHNISEGLVVATAVRTEIQDAEEEALTHAKASNGKMTSRDEQKSQREFIRCKSKRWIAPAVLKTTLSHIGQPFGLLAVLYAEQLGLAGMNDMPLFVACIQGVSFGSIGAAIVLEALPEVVSAAKALLEVFVMAPRKQARVKAD